MYCAGNPIKFVDPNGREIWIHYTDDNGRQQSFQYFAGMECNIDNTIAQSIVANLNTMYSNEAGHKVIDAILAETTRYGYMQGDTHSEGGEGYYNPLTNIVSMDNVNNTLTFAEETFHIYQYVNNQGGTTDVNEVEAKLFSAKMNLEIDKWFESNNGSYAKRIAGNGLSSYPDNMSKLLLYGYNEEQYKSAVDSFFDGSLGGLTYKMKGYTKGKIKQNPLIKEFLPVNLTIK